MSSVLFQEVEVPADGDCFYYALLVAVGVLDDKDLYEVGSLGIMVVSKRARAAAKKLRAWMLQALERPEVRDLFNAHRAEFAYEGELNDLRQRLGGTAYAEEAEVKLAAVLFDLNLFVDMQNPEIKDEYSWAVVAPDRATVYVRSLGLRNCRDNAVAMKLDASGKHYTPLRWTNKACLRRLHKHFLSVYPDTAQEPDVAQKALAEYLDELVAAGNDCLTLQKTCDKRKCDPTGMDEPKCRKKLTKVLRKKLHKLIDDVPKSEDYFSDFCWGISIPQCVYVSDYCQVIQNFKDPAGASVCAPKLADSSEPDADESTRPAPAKAKAKAKATAGAKAKAKAKARSTSESLQAVSEHADSSDLEAGTESHEIPAGTYDVSTCGNLADLLRKTHAFADKKPENYTSVFNQGFFETTTIKELLTTKKLIFNEKVSWPWKAGHCKIA